MSSCRCGLGLARHNTVFHHSAFEAIDAEWTLNMLLKGRQSAAGCNADEWRLKKLQQEEEGSWTSDSSTQGLPSQAGDRSWQRAKAD